MGENNKSDLLSISFNQLNDCFSVATVNGFSVFTTEPFAENVSQPKRKPFKFSASDPRHLVDHPRPFSPTHPFFTVSKRIRQWKYIHHPNAFQKQHPRARRRRSHPSLPPNQGDDLGRRTRPSNWRTRLQNPRQISLPQTRQNSSSS